MPINCKQIKQKLDALETAVGEFEVEYKEKSDLEKLLEMKKALQEQIHEIHKEIVREKMIDWAKDLSSFRVRYGEQIEKAIDDNIDFTNPGELVWHGELNLFNDKQVKEISKELQVIDGNLVLTDCDHLTKLPKKMKVNGNANFLACDYLEELPHEFYVSKKLFLTNCKKLKKIPDGLDALEMDITGCNGLQDISDDIKIRKSIWMYADFHLKDKIEKLKKQGKIRSINYVVRNN